MHLARMTDETWAHLLAMRWKTAPQISSPGAVDPACLSLYQPMAVRGEAFVLAQVGQSLDGRVATPTGDAGDVSGPDGISHLHRCRALVDAVVVGVGTVVADDPRLSVRAVEGPSPVRVVIDCNGRLPQTASMLRDSGTPLIVIQADDQVLPSYGGQVEVVRLPRRQAGLHPEDILASLVERGLTTILVEGGATTIARFIDADIVDHLHVCVSPIIIGSGPAGISLSAIDRLSEARRPKVSVFDIGTDIVFDCELKASRGTTPALAHGKDILVAHPA